MDVPVLKMTALEACRRRRRDRADIEHNMAGVRWLYRYIGSATATACPLRGYGRAGTQNDSIGGAVVLSTGTRMPARQKRRRRRRDRAGVELAQPPVRAIPSTESSMAGGPPVRHVPRHAHRSHFRRHHAHHQGQLCVGSISGVRRRHVQSTGMGVPVLKMTASARTCRRRRRAREPI